MTMGNFHRSGVITGSLLFVLLSHSNYHVSASCRTICSCNCRSYLSNDTSPCMDVKTTANPPEQTFSDCQDVCQEQGDYCDATALVCVTTSIITANDTTSCLPGFTSPTVSPTVTLPPSSDGGNETVNYNNTCTCFCKSCTADSGDFLTASACDSFCGQSCEDVTDHVFECHSSSEQEPSSPTTKPTASTASTPFPSLWKSYWNLASRTQHDKIFTLQNIQAWWIQSVAVFCYAWLLLL
jgi:hypothetical protein